jgi:hypothetical protein
VPLPIRHILATVLERATGALLDLLENGVDIYVGLKQSAYAAAWPEPWRRRTIFEDASFVVALDADGKGTTLRECFADVFDRAGGGLQLEFKPVHEGRVQASGYER